jgi:hypothetical protein
MKKAFIHYRDTENTKFKMVNDVIKLSALGVSVVQYYGFIDES